MIVTAAGASAALADTMHHKLIDANLRITTCLDEALAHENNLGDFVDARHPRIADELRIQCGNAGP